jgi:hypothetical protein
MSLAKKLQREAKANPVKAAALGVLLLVAGYFWAPLVKGFVSPAATAPAATATAGAPATPAPAPTPTVDAPKAPESPVYDWQRYAQLLDDDVKMRTSAELPSPRDPFKSREVERPEIASVKTAAQLKAAEAPPLEPREAGLVLSSTFVGPRTQIALIGGKPYRIGDRVRVQKDGIKASFNLIDVQPRLVVLERNGKQYELTITRGRPNTKETLTADENEDGSDEDESPESEMAVDGPAAR